MEKRRFLGAWILFVFAALLVSTLSPDVRAQGFDSTLNSLFKDDRGQVVTPRALQAAPDKGYLLLFWAGWCVPCKEELALVSRNPDRLQAWTPIAVNVDDAGGRVRADGILKSLNWPFASVYDDGGAVFFQINSSGELPLALAFDSQGRLLEVIRELKEPTLLHLEQLSPKTSNQHQGGWEISEEFHYIQRERTNGRSEVGTNTLGIRYSSARWQAGFTHNLIRQKRDPAAGWSLFEDEIGPSYIQIQTSESRARLGDDTVEWGKGQLLSARALPGTSTNASLLGAHYHLNHHGYSLDLAAGRVRQQLFGLLLDPTVDLTDRLPREDVVGGTLNKNFHLNDKLNLKAGLGYLRYQRSTLASNSTAYLLPHEDRRLHYNLGLTQDAWGLELTQTHYSVDRSQDIDLKSSRATQVDGFVRSQPDAHLQLGLTYLLKGDAIPRTFTPVLTEYPALPILLDGLRSWRVAPRLIRGEWSFEPQWIAEQSTRPADAEKQDTYVLQALKPAAEFKSIALHQRHLSGPLNSLSEASAFVLGSALGSQLTGQMEYKTYKARGQTGNTSADQGGRSAAVQVGWKIEKTFEQRQVGQWLLAVTRTHQDGYYLGISGIDRKELTGVRLTWTLKAFELRLATLQEPGGIVCSGGVCAQRPPLDGLAIESKMQWNF